MIAQRESLQAQDTPATHSPVRLGEPAREQGGTPGGLPDLHKALGLESANGRYLAFCPYHEDRHKPALGIFRNGVYCFACGASRGVLRFLAENPPGTIRVVGNAGGAHRVGVSARTRDLPESLASAYATLLRGPLAQRRTWLHARGLTDATIDTYQLGHSGAAFTIPVLGRQPEPDLREAQVSRRLLALRFRRDHGRTDAPCGEPWCDPSVCPKYFGLSGFNQTLLYDPAAALAAHPRTLVLCEGELDTLLLVQHGYPAVTFTNGVGGLKRQHLAFFDHVPEILLCLDQDEAGRRRAATLASWFGGRARWIRWPHAKDVTDLLHTAGLDAFERALTTCAGVYDRRNPRDPPRPAAARPQPRGTPGL
ncbi:MAG: toprim domain-containing protein [Chloroflexi bacterium]|nr:toprim domain-containing protein [Chloroflexota bacterium]